MNVIEVENLRKEFKSYSSRSGLKGLFAIYSLETIKSTELLMIFPLQ